MPISVLVAASGFRIQHENPTANGRRGWDSSAPVHCTLCAHAPITQTEQESLALASMARDDLPASSTASSTAPASSPAAAAARRPMRGKVGSEFET